MEPKPFLEWVETLPPIWRQRYRQAFEACDRRYRLEERENETKSVSKHKIVLGLGIGTASDNKGNM